MLVAPALHTDNLPRPETPSSVARTCIDWRRYSRGRSNNSGKVRDAHSVDVVGYLNLGVFAVTGITTKHTNAVSPKHLIPGTPNAACARSRRCRAPTASLAGFARLA